MVFTLRSWRGERHYAKAKKAGKTHDLQTVMPLMEWDYWKLIPNEYPYDMVFEKHDMIIPKRNFATRSDIKPKELKELNEILAWCIEPWYHVIFENSCTRRSNFVLYHIHVGKYKSKRRQIKLW